MKRFDIFAYLDGIAEPSHRELEDRKKTPYQNSIFEGDSHSIAAKAIRSFQESIELYRGDDCPASRLFNDRLNTLMRECVFSDTLSSIDQDLFNFHF